jgi:hypothetical protein
MLTCKEKNKRENRKMVNERLRNKENLQHFVRIKMEQQEQKQQQ